MYKVTYAHILKINLEDDKKVTAIGPMDKIHDVRFY